jgi:lysophospholipase L1-like esterase
MSRRTRRVLQRRLVFAVVPLLTLATLAELSVRMWVPEPALAQAGPLGWTMQPNLNAHPVDQAAPQPDFWVTTNSDGLRTSYGRETSAPRAVTLGESTIFGWGLPSEHAPAQVLQDLLGHGWEVVNGGQPGYSSEQARRLAQQLIPLYNPDLVIWFHPWNDLAPAKATDRDLLPLDESGLSVLSRSRLVRWLRDPTGLRSRSFQDNALMPLRYVGPGEGQRVTPFQRADNLAQLVQAAEGRDLWVVLLPNDATAAQGGISPLALELAQLTQDLGVPWLDLTGALDSQELGELTLPGDPGHFNLAGNQRLMSLVATHLAESGWTTPP